MLITSLLNNKETAGDLYKELDKNQEEFYELCLKAEQRIKKLKMINSYSAYVRSYGDLYQLVNNPARKLKWRDYNVLYIPEEVSMLNADFISGLEGKLLILGGNSWTTIRLGTASKLTHVIMACRFQGSRHLDAAFMMQDKVEDIVIYGKVYDKNHVLTKSLHITSMAEAFSRCKSLERIVLKEIDFDNMESVAETFSDCKKLREIYIDSLRKITPSKAEGMFRGCESIRELDLSCFSMIRVDDTVDMFKGCSNLVYIDLNALNFRRVYHLNGMFEGCTLLKRVNLSSLKTHEIISMTSMIKGCDSLVSTGVLAIDLKIKARRFKQKLYGGI